MDHEHFAQWLDQIYNTSETEIGCERLQALLPAYVDFEIAGADLNAHFLEARAHLAQCPDCAEEYEGLRRVAALEAQGRLPQAEEILARFEAAPALESGAITRVPAP